jgi:lambda repressor-like predicted transcriptional regulator
MIKYRINKQRIEAELEKRLWNYTDLARKLGWSRSLLHWGINRGSRSFAPKIAAALDCKPEELVITIGGAGKSKKESGQAPGKRARQG